MGDLAKHKQAKSLWILSIALTVLGIFVTLFLTLLILKDIISLALYSLNFNSFILSFSSIAEINYEHHNNLYISNLVHLRSGNVYANELTNSS